MTRTHTTISQTEGTGDRPFVAWIPIPDGPPTYTAQQRRWGVRGGHPYTYTDAKAKATKSDLTAYLKPHAPKQPFSSPIRLEMVLIYPYRKADKKAQKSGCIVPKSTRPDLDNSLKLLQDVMTATGYWDDDALICDLHASKAYGAEPGIHISIEEIK